MLELPESAVISRQMNEALAEKTIIFTEAGHTPHGFAWYFGDSAEYDDKLRGKKISEVRPNSGQIEIVAEDMRIVFNDGTNIRRLSPGAEPPKKRQLYMKFDDGGALFCSVQMYGGIMAFKDGEHDNPYYLVSKSKPSPYSAEFSLDYFKNLWEQTDKKLSVKAFLAAEQRIPGFGNGCLQDVLFHAGLNPQSKLKYLKESDIDNLYDKLKNTLIKMRDLGGRDTEKDFYGAPGGYHTILSHKTKLNPCPNCLGNITRKQYMGGNVYFCGTCQPIASAE